jgi:hypothetical protein
MARRLSCVHKCDTIRFVKTVSVREFRNQLAEELKSTVPVVIHRHGRNIAIVYSLAHPTNIPVEVRRSIVDSVGHELDVKPRWHALSPVVEVYKRDVDRTLIRENLRRSPEERLIALQKLQDFARELRRARR